MTVLDYIYEQPKELQSILLTLRHLILDSSPQVQEHFDGVPFYTYHRLFCYLNITKTHVTLGMCQGRNLSNEQGILTGNGKQVKHIVVKSLQTIPTTSIREILQEALLVNELHEETKKRKKRQKHSQN
ncbi:DUF1801 domain-containing protein [Xanthocytophaga flava]|uniref:DUF1801 domain-containing protein n=1 Tax=Xanthocytophaga flava TaxID=3048013 RepID=UPI0028D7CA2A|nr:DUF1801 domain-containing protein [Xanthocytophaga flavus]MDJ1468456.1 DUF1801 domain-containing protein [Xanthocytophaga flavus]